MTTSLPRFAVIAVLLAVALASFAQRPATTRAEGSADNVQPIQLAMMNLPLSGYGPNFSSFILDSASAGFDPKAFKPAPSTLNAYSTSFISPDESFAEEGPILVGSTVAALPTASDASTFVGLAVAALQSDGGGGTLTTFNVADPAGAQGVELSQDVPELGVTLHFTGVIFPLDRLIGAAVIFRISEGNDQADTIAAAQALAERMKGVLTGTITDFPAPLPPDVNCDGSLDSIDASLVLQLSAELVDSLPCDALADANQDGRTNAIDASLILQYSAGLIASLPVAG